MHLLVSAVCVAYVLCNVCCVLYRQLQCFRFMQTTTAVAFAYIFGACFMQVCV